MILANASGQTQFVGSAKTRSSSVNPDGDAPRPLEKPLTDQEVADFSRIKCCVCGKQIDPDEIAAHSKVCVLAPAPNHVLQLDKWCIVSATMTADEKRVYLSMRP